MTWHTGRLAAFDLETTGVNADEARIVSSAFIGVGGNKPTTPRTWIVDPGIEIPAEAAAVHGITTERARAEGRPAAEAVEEIAAAVAGALNSGVPIAGHNVVYDLTVLDRECRRHQLPTVVDRYVDDVLWPVIDTMVLDKHVLPYRRRISEKQGPRQLITLAQVYGLPWDDKAAHGSEYDALQAARIAYRIGAIAHRPHGQRPDWVRAERSQRFDDVAGLDLEALHHAQIKWAREDAASFQAWLRSEKAGAKRDQAAAIDGTWPLRPWAGETS